MVLLKTSDAHFKSFNLLHMSLILSAIVEDILRTVFDFLYLPSIYRHCVCDVIIGTILTSETLFFTVYRPVAFACLGVLQLLVIRGKKKYANIKTAFGMIAVCVAISLFFVAATIRMLYETDERPFCSESYCPESRPESGFSDLLVIFVLVTLGSFLPSLVIVIVTSTWSCAVFKKYYIGGDDQLNRRILSLPVVMPLVILSSTLIEAAVAFLIAEIILILSVGEYFPYWITVTQSFVLALLRVFTRLTYPFVLVYTHSHVRKATKKLLKRLKPSNRVTPESVATHQTDS